MTEIKTRTMKNSRDLRDMEIPETTEGYSAVQRAK